MKSPIKYTIENINGKQYVSDSFDINDNVYLIRIIKRHPISENGVNAPELTINSFLINGIEINYKDVFNISAYRSVILDLNMLKFIKSSNDLAIDIKENSKIEIHIFIGDKPKETLFNYDEIPFTYFNKK